MVEPLRASRATTEAAGPPTGRITLPASTSGEQEYPNSVPRPPNCWFTLTDHNGRPSAACRQPTRPSGAAKYSLPSRQVGVALGPGYIPPGS